MIILIVAVILTGLGILILRHDEFSFVGILLSVCGGFVLLLFLVFIFLNPLTVKGEIREFESIRQTIAVARETGNELEKAAIQHKIIDNNEWLAGVVYWNETIFDIFIPDEVMQLKPLK